MRWTPCPPTNLSSSQAARRGSNGDGAVSTLADGDSIVLCEGAAFRWSADADTRLIFVRRTGGSAADGAIVPIDTHAALVASGAPLAELLVGPTPSCRNFTDYRSADGAFVCGTWDSTPYHRRAMTYGHYELMYLLDGSVTFVDGAGASGTFDKGDIFLVEQGASCSWDSQGPRQENLRHLPPGVNASPACSQ